MATFQANAGGPTDFAKLLEESRQLTSHIDTHGMPGIERNAEQIHELSRKLASKAGDVAVSDRDKSRAAVLLAARGFDADRLARNLNAVDVKTTYESYDAIHDTDIVGYLNQQHEMIILTALGETQQTVVSEFKKNYVRSMEREWEGAKQELLDALGQRSSEWNRDFAVPTSSSHTADTPHRVGGANYHRRSDMNSVMLEYARVVYTANESRVPHDPFPIVTSFKQAAKRLEAGQAKKERVRDCWKALAQIVGERNVKDGKFQREVLQENAYADMMANSTYEMERVLLRGARAFLESQYDKHITRVIRQHPERAQLGPKPGLLYRVRAFLNVKFGHDGNWPAEFHDIVDGFPVWAQIYYCLRCGDPEAALMIAESCAGVLDRFVFYLREYVSDKSNMLPLQLWNQLLNDYRNISRGQADPFKLLVYNLIGRCDLNAQSPQVLTTTQDFLWMKLSLITDPEVARSLPESFAHTYSLAQLQELLTKFGPGHFNPGGRNPLHFFQVLLLSQQFEKAIHFLSSVEQYRADAVHFGIALSYYGVLRAPSSGQAELLGTNAAGETTLNIAKVIRQYVRLFAKTDPREALQYLYFIPDPATRLESIKNLVLETKEYALFFGGVAEDGSRQPGCMAKFLGEAESPHILEIVKLAATDCERNGLYDDAITLYELSKDFDRVLMILSKQLSQVLAVSGTSHERRRFLDLARQIDNKYNDSVFRHMRDPRLVTIVSTFKLVMNLVTFFDLYHAGRFEDALAHMESLALLPLRPEDGMEQAVESFKLLDEPIRRNFADILLTTMTILYKIYSALKGRQSNDAHRQQYIHALRAKSRAIITFVGMIQFHMPGDTNARLIRMDVFMN